MTHFNDKWKNDEDFTPSGINAWTGLRYKTKINNLASTIRDMATDVTPDGLAIFGLCEVENKNVVLDLVNSNALRPRHYEVVHIEGPDPRGVDPSFVYNPLYFKVTKAIACPVRLFTDSNYRTRDILVVSGIFLGEHLNRSCKPLAIPQGRRTKKQGEQKYGCKKSKAHCR